MQFLSPVPPPLVVVGGGEAPADHVDHDDQHAEHSNHVLLSLHFPGQLQTEDLGILRPLCRFSNVLRHLGHPRQCSSVSEETKRACPVLPSVRTAALHVY